MKSTLKGKVETILKLFPETRNSDTLLSIILWKEYFAEQLITGKDGESKYIKLEDLFRLPSMRDIARYRAKIQNEERAYPATDPEVIRMRSKLESRWRKEMTLKVPPYMQEPDMDLFNIRK